MPSPRSAAGGRGRWRVLTGQIVLQHHKQRSALFLARTGTITAFAVRVSHVLGAQNREGSLRGAKLLSRVAWCVGGHARILVCLHQKVREREHFPGNILRVHLSREVALCCEAGKIVLAPR
jgi:hypothetical protein